MVSLSLKCSSLGRGTPGRSLLTLTAGGERPDFPKVHVISTFDVGVPDASQITTPCVVSPSIESTTRRTMLVSTVLQWTATNILLSNSGGQCQTTYDEEGSSCVYSFIVPNGQAEDRCPGREQSMETLRMKASLSQLQFDL